MAGSITPFHANNYGGYQPDYYDGYQGVILQETLEETPKADYSNVICSDVMEDINPISPDAVLEEVIPDTLDTEFPLPVVDEDGDLQGELSRQSLVKVLGAA